MSIHTKSTAPAVRIATAVLAIITVFGTVSCSASGSTAPQAPTTTTSPKGEDTDSEVKVSIESYNDEEGNKYGDKSFAITKDGEQTKGDIICTGLGLTVILEELNGEHIEDIPGVSSARIILKNHPACEDGFLTDNEASEAVDDIASGL